MYIPNTVEQRLDLITRRIPLENISGLSTIKESLERNDRKPRCLWVTSPTGKPHIGYFIPLLKFADLLAAGVEIVVVLLDVYSYLDNVNVPMEQVQRRMDYYKFTVKAALQTLGIPTSTITFVQESSYELNPRFVTDNWRLCTVVPQQAVRDAWDRSYNPTLLSPMLCPGLQTLAEEHLDIDFQLGGEDQCGIFEFAERFLPKIGYQKRAHLMNPMLPNLQGGKMSSSHPPHTKILFLDGAEAIKDKIDMAFDNAESMEKNGVLLALKNILIPASTIARNQLINHKQLDSFQDDGDGPYKSTFYSEDAPNGTVFTIEVDRKHSHERKHYSSYEDIEADLTDGRLASQDLKMAITRAFNQLLEPIRKSYKLNGAWQTSEQQGYPRE